MVSLSNHCHMIDYIMVRLQPFDKLRVTSWEAQGDKYFEFRNSKIIYQYNFTTLLVIHHTN